MDVHLTCFVLKLVKRYHHVVMVTEHSLLQVHVADYLEISDFLAEELVQGGEQEIVVVRPVRDVFPQPWDEPLRHCVLLTLQEAVQQYTDRSVDVVIADVVA